MQYKYGNFSFDASLSVNEAIERVGPVSRAYKVVQHKVKGTLRASTQSALDTLIGNCKSAFQTDGKNAGLYYANGSQTQHVLVSANSLGGVRVLDGPSFTNVSGSEYTTYHTFEVTLEARFRANTLDNLIEYQESLTTTSQPNRLNIVQTADGSPSVLQRIPGPGPTQTTQSGFALTYTDNFTFPTPLASANLLSSTTNKTAPLKSQGNEGQWRYTWQYTMIFA